MLSPSRIHLARAGLLLFLVGLWQLLWVWGLPAYVLSPIDIVKHFFAALGSEELYQHIGASLLRSLPGFAIGTLLGIALGLLAGVTRAFEQMLSPVIFLTYPVPKIVMLPLFMLWFGIGDQHGRRQAADLPQGGVAERPAADLRRPARVARAVLHRHVRHRDDQCELRPGTPHPGRGERPALRPDVRIASHHRDPRLRGRHAAAPCSPPRPRLAGTGCMRHPVCPPDKGG